MTYDIKGNDEITACRDFIGSHNYNSLSISVPILNNTLKIRSLIYFFVFLFSIHYLNE